MKLFIASDIHGDINSARAVVDAYRKSGADRLLLLGDILYHGPRNALPGGYAPKEVIELLNSIGNEILCVRGNCDTEVDQMVLDFQILAEYAFIEADGVRMLATHGHKINTASASMRKGEILLHGHTHVSCALPFGDGNVYINPGSASIPKENTPKGYIVYENRVFSFFTLDGEEYMTYNV